MSAMRERSAGPASAQPRMLRIEYKGQPYDWFNLDEMGDIVRTADFSNTLRENVTHYFGVPLEYQAIYDEEGILSSMVDFSRALRSARPWLRVYDAREMKPDLKEKTARQLDEVHAEVTRTRHSLTGWGFGAGIVGSAAAAQQSFSSTNGHSPPQLMPPQQQDPNHSLADTVKHAIESRRTFATPPQLGASGRHQPPPPTAFPWGGIEAYGPPSAATGHLSSPRYHTPPPQNFHHSIGHPNFQHSIGHPVPVMMHPQARTASPARPGHGTPGMMVPSLSQSGGPPMMQGQRMGQPHSHHVPPYGGGMPTSAGLPPQVQQHAIGSSTPPMPGYQGHPAHNPLHSSSSGLSHHEVSRQTAAPETGGFGTPRGPTVASAQSKPHSGAAVASANSATVGGNVIEVVLEKEGSERFGFANVPDDHNRLEISWVDPRGLLETTWNCNNPGQQVVEKDKIIAVNGREGDVEAMRDQLQQNSVILIIQRCRS